MATVKLRVRELLARREDQENRRIRLAEVAEAAGVSIDTLTPMLNNETDHVSLAALAKLCDYFRCMPADLLSFAAEPSTEDALDVREIVNKWEQHYGADEHPPR